MRILVTGGAGFIGTNLIKRLVSEGHEVFSIDNYSTGKKENHIDGCTYFEANILNLHAFDGSPMLEDIDVVYHLAAKARIQPSFKDPEHYIEANFNGTYSVIKYCIKHDIPLIYAGSSSIYNGELRNPYTFSKHIAEELLMLYGEHFGLKYAIAIFYNVYGSYQILGGENSTLIGRWLYNKKHNIPCEIYGDGEKRRDFTHVDDIVDGLIKIMEKHAYDGNIFNFGRGKNYSINNIASFMGIKPIYKEEKPGEAYETLCDDTDSYLAKKLLGWHPIKDIKDYLSR